MKQFKLNINTKTQKYPIIIGRGHNLIKLSNEQKEKVIVMLESLDENDDVQNIFINCKF